MTPDYRFDLAKGPDASVSVGRMRQAHNRTHEPDKSVELRRRVPERDLWRLELQERGLYRRKLDEMRIEHLPGRLLSGVPQRALGSTTFTGMPPST